MCGTHNPIASCNTVHSKHSKYYKDPEISVLRAMLHLKTSALLHLVDYEVQMASDVHRVASGTQITDDGGGSHSVANCDSTASKLIVASAGEWSNTSYSSCLWLTVCSAVCVMPVQMPGRKQAGPR